MNFNFEIILVQSRSRYFYQKCFIIFFYIY